MTCFLKRIFCRKLTHFCVWTFRPWRMSYKKLLLSFFFCSLTCIQKKTLTFLIIPSNYLNKNLHSQYRIFIFVFCVLVCWIMMWHSKNNLRLYWTRFFINSIHFLLTCIYHHTKHQNIPKNKKWSQQNLLARVLHFYIWIVLRSHVTIFAQQLRCQLIIC